MSFGVSLRIFVGKKTGNLISGRCPSPSIGMAQLEPKGGGQALFSWMRHHDAGASEPETHQQPFIVSLALGTSDLGE